MAVLARAWICLLIIGGRSAAADDPTAPAHTFTVTGGQFALDGKPLGRIWSIGPQRTSYVPGVWLEARDNQVIVLDLLGVEHPLLSSLREPILNAAVPSRVTNN
jgi:beta-galactosidase